MKKNTIKVDCGKCPFKEQCLLSNGSASLKEAGCHIVKPGYMKEAARKRFDTRLRHWRNVSVSGPAWLKEISDLEELYNIPRKEIVKFSPAERETLSTSFVN